MAATIDPFEVAFPFGEEIEADGRTTCKIIPDKDANGQVLETGKIQIEIPYKSATVKGSNNKPLNRLFSICNRNNNGSIFNDILQTRLVFSTDMKPVVDPDNAPKEFKIVIAGAGPKKNSAN